MSIATFTPAGLAPGRYPATITKVEEDEAKHGPIYRVTFEAENGDGELSQFFSRRDDGKITPGSRMGSMVNRLLNPQYGDQLDPVQDLVGKRCEIFVEEKVNKDGNAYGRVADVLALENQSENGTGTGNGKGTQEEEDEIAF